MSFILSNTQMKIFHQAAFEKYTNDLIAYFHQEYPYLKEITDEENLRIILSQQIKFAESRGFTQQETTKFFIEMVILFGVSFESDIQYPWIKNTINTNRDFAEVDRAQALYFEVEKYLESIYGKKNAYRMQFNSKFSHFLDANDTNIEEQLKHMDIQDAEIFNSRKTQWKVITKKNLPIQLKVQEYLAKSFPEKFNTLDTKTQHELIALGIQKANLDNQTQGDDQILLTTLSVFLFGQRFDTDPFLSTLFKQKMDTTTLV